MQETARLSEAAAWLADLERALNARDIPRALSLFVEDCYWRDFLSLTWNIKTMEGKPAIAAMLEATLDARRANRMDNRKGRSDQGRDRSLVRLYDPSRQGRRHLSSGGSQVPNHFDHTAILIRLRRADTLDAAAWDNSSR